MAEINNYSLQKKIEVEFAEIAAAALSCDQRIKAMDIFYNGEADIEIWMSDGSSYRATFYLTGESGDYDE